MRSQVEFFFDCSSTWSYLAFHRIQELAAELDFELVWRPILVGGVFNAVNDSVYESRRNPVPAKAAYLAKDLSDWAEYSGLKILWPPTKFPINSANAMRGCIAANNLGILPVYAQKMFRAYWGNDRDISSMEVILELAAECGLDPVEHRLTIESDEIRERLKTDTQDLIDRGGFGTPTMFVNETDMYFGRDRLELVASAVRTLQGD
jgi:2-hydroxychromene-2-carboxylate isomerase